MTARTAGKAKKPAPTKSSTKATAAAALDARLKGLSVALEETSRQYVRRLQREIFEVSRALPSRRGKDLAKIGRLLDSLHIKAPKGRRKDLKKIDLLIGDLQKLVES